MPPLKTPITFETAFATYTATAILGEGGAGRVFAATQDDGNAVAIKVLAQDRASSDKRKRFKNELNFLLRNRHQHIVTVIDHGLSKQSAAPGPFYVMQKYDCSVRQLIVEKIESAKVMRLFAQLLDGVEAAHLLGAIHRDLKPENILVLRSKNHLAVADFGVASFTEELLLTAVETRPTQRLANFQYAAPEQRVAGTAVTKSADLYALGLILNELFTGIVPHGTDFKKIGTVSGSHAYLDEIVDQLTRQTPSSRPTDIASLKSLIQKYEVEAVSRQRISVIADSVVTVGTVDDPLAMNPVRVVGANWDGSVLTLTLDKPVTRAWVDALNHMGSYASVAGRGPEHFSFSGNSATVAADEHEAQNIITHFKNWMPMTTAVLKQKLEDQARREEAQHRDKLQREREAEERKLRVNSKLNF